MIIFSHKAKPTLFTNTVLLFLSVFVLSIQNSKGKKALIFDRFTRSLFHLPKTVSHDAECGAWAVACSAETSVEKNFIEKYSFTKNAMFVKTIHERGSKASEVKTDVCNEPYQISLTYNMKSFTFQFGFEIYYRLKDEDYFHIHNFKDYKPPKDVAKSMTSYLKVGKYVGKEIIRAIKNTFVKNDTDELWFNNDRRLGFTWIYLVKFKFHFFTKIVKQMMYVIGPNSRWPVPDEICENYSLGSEFYEGIDLDDDLYKQNERNKFANLKLPKEITCWTNFDCFKKHSIIPLDQFRFGASSRPLCSNMATIPIWKFKVEIEHVLKKVDQYLFVLYRVLDEPLHIIAGISGEHKFSKKRSWAKSTIYLDSKKNIIPVPKIIYKIVDYRLKNCKLEEIKCWYSVVIVIHNDPLFKSSDRLCSEKHTEDWGWEALTVYPEVKSQLVYVCPKDKNIKKKLFEATLHNMPESSHILQLSHFPTTSDGIEVGQEDKRTEVNSMFAKFTAHGDDNDINDEKIMEMAQEDVNPENTALISDAAEIEQTEETPHGSGESTNVHGRET